MLTQGFLKLIQICIYNTFGMVETTYLFYNLAQLLKIFVIIY